jgi:hypothetical protein
MCQHITDSFADSASYFSACTQCGEVLAEHFFVRPALKQRLTAFAGSAGRSAAKAARTAPADFLWAILLLLNEKLFGEGYNRNRMRDWNRQQIDALAIRFAILDSMDQRFPDDPEEVSRRIGMVDIALDLQLSSASFGERPG